MENKNYKVVMLTVFTLSVFTLAVLELMGVSNWSFRNIASNGRDNTFFDKNGQRYHGIIYPEDMRTRYQQVSQMPKTTIQFYETKYNFGSVPAGRVVTHVFRYKNTGQNPLMISKTDVTCGCTVSNFQLESVAPGNDGEIAVDFDTQGKSGPQQKNITVHSNALPEAVTIGIEADVK